MLCTIDRDIQIVGNVHNMLAFQYGQRRSKEKARDGTEHPAAEVGKLVLSCVAVLLPNSVSTPLFSCIECSQTGKMLSSPPFFLNLQQ
ncbi:hypothetical protein MRB53_001158 [Persea americana]|uniref:Uncharacterized protein n=1 Tax=Persea americana TaxID=3435 RepID=A0ACC2MR82_PERAE|nr:hypothetical protein MRB53_001158 [Persea americana]